MRPAGCLHFTSEYTFRLRCDNTTYRPPKGAHLPNICAGVHGPQVVCNASYYACVGTAYRPYCLSHLYREPLTCRSWEGPTMCCMWLWTYLLTMAAVALAHL